MALDPKVRALLTAIAAAEEPTIYDMPASEARSFVSSRFRKMNLPCHPVQGVSSITAEIEGLKIPLRIYTPEGEGPHPVALFFHGGGWVLFNTEDYDHVCTHLCAVSKCLVVSVEYRLAPEDKFPAAIDDCYWATRWVGKEISRFGGNPGLISLIGDSAGGTLAVVTAMRLRDEGGPAIAGQVLIYPATGYYRDERASYREFAEGFGLTMTDMAWFWNHYLTGPHEAENPHVCPIRAGDLSRLPDTLVILAGNDLLRDEGAEFAHRLEKAGIPVHLTIYEDMIHGFVSYLGLLGHAKTAIREISGWLNHRFAETKRAAH